MLLGASDLLSQVRLTAMVTLMVENLFLSDMLKDDPMPTQLEYGARRATCVRELQKRMYRVTSVITPAQKAITLIRLSTADIHL